MAITIHCNETDLGAFSILASYTKDFQGIYLKEIAVGKVVYLRERNMYDDSDFFAAYWNEETNTVEEVMYGTTRGWCATHATVDATAEVRQAYEAWRKVEQEQADIERAQQRAARIEVGKNVMIIKASKAKAALVNQVGVVTWVGPSKFKHGSMTARVDINGDRQYFDFANLKVA